METFWNILAVLCVVAAFIFFWFGNFDGVFISAVLGCVAWMFTFRTQVRRRVAAREAQRNEEN